jgi:hypothetical protein
VSGEVIRPFRWDVTQRSQLGTLPDGPLPEAYDGFLEDLVECCARVVAFAGDSDLIFVGRSLECLFDLLSGLLIGTSWEDRASLLNVSLRHVEPPDAIALRNFAGTLELLGAAPSQLAVRRRPAAFVDVVASGRTFAMLFGLLKQLAADEGADWGAALHKLRFVGVTWRDWSGPDTWRWQQHADWVSELRPGAVKNVSAPYRFATYLAADVPKSSRAFQPADWTDESVLQPLHDEEALLALRLAHYLFQVGMEAGARRYFVAELRRQPAVKESWCRSLSGEVKR